MKEIKIGRNHFDVGVPRNLEVALPEYADYFLGQKNYIRLQKEIHIKILRVLKFSKNSFLFYRLYNVILLDKSFSKNQIPKQSFN